ncbi:MAG: biopolymer transporter ExbD [Planctomycetes bacterium]|nr:biopolymer transporter ExbD [Planctomycetota bacterium]
MARRVREETVDLNLTPLIDMIFILLIFFMVTASFVQESAVEVERPVAQTAESKNPAVIVSIDANSVVWVDNKTVDVRAVQSWMAQFLSASPEGAVVIAADAKSQTGVTIQVLDACRLAGVKNVSVAAALN